MMPPTRQFGKTDIQPSREVTEGNDRRSAPAVQDVAGSTRAAVRARVRCVPAGTRVLSEATVTTTTSVDRFDLIPKVELHCHVEGTVRPETVVHLPRKAGRPLPVEDPAELYRYDSLDSFLAIFWLVQETLDSRDDWARIAYESLLDGAAHGLRYREMFFTPARHLAAGQDLAAIVAGLTDGSEAAEAETGVRCMLIGDIDRAYGPGAGLELVEGLGALRRSGTGRAGHRDRGRLDRAGRRPRGVRAGLRGGPPARAAPDVPRRRSRRRRTGEHPVAIDDLGAERIDHGVAIVEDPELMAQRRPSGSR